MEPVSFLMCDSNIVFLITYDEEKEGIPYFIQAFPLMPLKIHIIKLSEAIPLYSVRRM